MNENQINVNTTQIEGLNEINQDHELRVTEATTIGADYLENLPDSGTYFKAFQAAQIPEFSFKYLKIAKNRSTLATVPVFSMKFYLSNILPQGILQKLFGRISFNLTCVGHPACDIGRIQGNLSDEVLQSITQHLRSQSNLVAFKGFSPGLKIPGFHEAKGLPVAVQKLGGQFWENLSGKRKSNFKQKMKAAEGIQFEVVSLLKNDEIDRIYELYLQVYNKADFKFEKLNRSYFATPCESYRYLLARKDGQIIGFAQMIIKNQLMVFRYIGIDYEIGQNSQVYFNLFFQAIQFAEKNKIQEIEWGATTYSFKKMLGADLVETSIYYCHQNPWINWILGKVKSLIEPSENDLK